MIDEACHVQLPWDSSHLGTFPEQSLVRRYKCERDIICEYLIPDHGIVTGIPCARNTKCPFFPTIVEELKKLFGLPVRGIHYFKYGKKEQVLYQVRRTATDILYEIPVSSLKKSHSLMSDQGFRQLMQETIVIIDVLCLQLCNESSIRVRRNVDGSYCPVAYNETKEKISNGHNSFTSVMSKNILTRWFGENESYRDAGRRLYQRVNGALLPQMEDIIKRYDPNYIWYVSIVNSRFYHLTECD